MTDTLNRLRAPRVWLRGLAAAFIGGSASALIADQGVTLLARIGEGVPLLTLKQFGAMAVGGGISSAAAFLAKSPLPPLPPTDEPPTA